MKIILLIILLAALLTGCESSIVGDPATIIKYSIPEKSNVKLTIENSYNTVIATLVDDNREPGVYSIAFNVSNLAEDVYFYTVEIRGTASNFYSKSTYKLLLVK